MQYNELVVLKLVKGDNPIEWYIEGPVDSIPGGCRAAIIFPIVVKDGNFRKRFSATGFIGADEKEAFAMWKLFHVEHGDYPDVTDHLEIKLEKNSKPR